jgi:hypothetical protein
VCVCVCVPQIQTARAIPTESLFSGGPARASGAGAWMQAYNMGALARSGLLLFSRGAGLSP